MNGLHGFRRPVCFRLRAVGDQVEGSERAPEPLPEFAAIVGVLGETDGDKRVSNLEENRGTSAREGVIGVLPTFRITLSGAK